MEVHVKPVSSTLPKLRSAHPSLRRTFFFFYGFRAVRFRHTVCPRVAQEVEDCFEGECEMRGTTPEGERRAVRLSCLLFWDGARSTNGTTFASGCNV